ncbi:MAG TPA: glycosyltransferase family 1 protein [Thermoanaerobaculaceae bacterium]|nr:glycosyltransferase family 1 protein [Thermoanaerobaculaceae bacterium]
MHRLGIDARKISDYGIGSYIQGLLGELARIDPPESVTLLIGSESRHELPELPETWRIVEVDAPGYSVKEQAAVLLAALRMRVDVLHVPHYVLPWLLPRRMVVTVHDIIHVLFPEFMPTSLGFAYARLSIRAAVKRARRIVTVSQTTADDLRRLFGASEDRLRVIPPGVQAEYLASPDRSRDEALLGGLGVSRPYLLHVGNHKPHKNAEGLLKAYQLLANDRRDSVPPLYMVGGFPPDGELARRAQAMGLAGKVRCLGHVERAELAALFRGANAFIYPTLYEGFGLPVLEAMACGVPVVAGDIQAVREVAGDAVLRVNPRDIVELAGAVRRLLGHAELRHELQARGRARAREYSWARAAEATLAVYRSVLEGA